MARKTYPSTRYGFSYSDPPVSGNWINGLGETHWRRARQIFHGSGARALEWARLESFFALTMPFSIYLQNLWNRWVLRNADGRIASPRRSVDPQTGTSEVKARALELGADGVGICALTEEALYEGYDPDYPLAISIMLHMDPEEMRFTPGIRSAQETMRVYMDISRIAIELAASIRARGFRARAYGESSDLLHLPIAVRAGLGELGKHGSLISKSHGPNVRLATVLTDMPLATDEPVDIGVEDLCAGCRRCTIDCPADAISDDKQMIRGVQRWYVDFDRCVPYFVKTMGCGICIEVCPWTKPDRGPSLSAKLLQKRAARRRP